MAESASRLVLWLAASAGALSPSPRARSLPARAVRAPAGLSLQPLAPRARALTRRAAAYSLFFSSALAQLRQRHGLDANRLLLPGRITRGVLQARKRLLCVCLRAAVYVGRAGRSRLLDEQHGRPADDLARAHVRRRRLLHPQAPAGQLYSGGAHPDPNPDPDQAGTGR